MTSERLLETQEWSKRWDEMNGGLLLCFLGALSFGLLGCTSKLAERKNCQASVLVALLFAWATLVMVMRQQCSVPGRSKGSYRVRFEPSGVNELENGDKTP